MPEPDVRNGCINDTYEPGSVFKIITMSAGLEEGVVHPSDSFYCPGYCIVEDRRIRCHKVGGHGSEDFRPCGHELLQPGLYHGGFKAGHRMLITGIFSSWPPEKDGH